MHRLSVETSGCGIWNFARLATDSSQLHGDVNLTLPIFDKNKGLIAEAEAKRAEAAVKVESAQVKESEEVDRALVIYEAGVQLQ